MSVIIKNGMIATAKDIFKGDIYIEDGLIKEIGLNINRKCDDVIDAQDQYVIPGGIDVHTHLNLDVGIAVATDDFYTGTVAAACGGTTCIVDHMGFGPKGCNLHHQLGVYHEYAYNNAVIDYGFHGVVQRVDDEILHEMDKMIEQEGISSFKVYLTYDYKLNDEEAYKVFKRVKEINGITAVHPENNDMVNYFRKYYIKNKLTSPIYHALSRPEECEAEAINRMINIASMADNSPLYIVHLSCELGLEYIKMAQAKGQNVYAETCPQYLFLDETKYNQPNNEGLKYIISPPLRKEYNQKALWKGLKDGNIHVVATDHCPFNFNSDKQMGEGDFTKCPNGAPGIETRVPLMFSEGVMKNRLDIKRFVDVVSTMPAKIFGLYPKKGTIAVGSDADIVIIDPHKKVTLSNEMLHENVDYTCYEGMELIGYPILTMSRGEIIVKDNVFIGKKGRGEFIKRNKFKI